MKVTSRRSPGPTLRFGLVLLVSLLYLMVGVNRPLNIYDEGLILHGAERVLAGDVPYRDFWTVYAPGQYYWLAGLFRVFGASVLVERLWDTLVRALLVTMLFLLAKRVAPPALAWAAWVVVLLWTGYYVFYGYPTFAALLFVVIAVWCLLHSYSADMDNGRYASRWFAMAGVSVGLATVFRHDFGFYAMVASLLTLVPHAFSRPVSDMLRPSERTTGLLRALAPFLGGMALVLVPVAVLLLASVPVTALWNDLVLFPLTVFPRVRALPYPQPSPALGLVLQGRASLTDLLDTAPNWLPFYLPLAVNLVAAPVVVARLVRRDRAPEHGALAIGFLVLFAAASFNQARVRADLVHLVQLLLPSFVVLAWLLGTLWRYRQGLGLLVGLLLMPLVWLSVMTPIEERSALLASGAPFRSAQQNHGIERAEGMPVDPFQAQTIRYLQQVVPEGEPIYVGAGRHDRVFVNDVLLYFLANRPSATAYYELHPGLTTTEEVQTRILNDLDQKDVQYLIVYTAFDDVQEPNESATSSGVSVLDDYVRANYQVLTQFGPHYYVWKRR